MKKQSFADILQQAKESAAQRMATKVPEWKDVPGLRFPGSLSTEQCSSSPTAAYKAGLALKLTGGGHIADLTGGLGVDSWAFSRIAEEVLYNEMDQELHDAAVSNFRVLSCNNIRSSCAVLTPDSIDSILGDFVPDMIFLDPARRSGTGKKVFLLEDCSPDLVSLEERLLDRAGKIMVKISPMADISMLRNRLSSALREVHVLGSGGECKELILILERKSDRPFSIIVAECSAGHACTLSFRPEEEAAAIPAFPENMDSLCGTVLFEPGSALAKSGCFNLLCQRFGLVRIGHFTHLYLCNILPKGLRPFGKTRMIKDVRALNNANMKATGREYPHSEVTARNIPMSSQELKNRMGVASGDDAHIYGVTADCTDNGSGRYLIITENTGR